MIKDLITIEEIDLLDKIREKTGIIFNKEKYLQSLKYFNVEIEDISMIYKKIKNLQHIMLAVCLNHLLILTILLFEYYNKDSIVSIIHGLIVGIISLICYNSLLYGHFKIILWKIW